MGSVLNMLLTSKLAFHTCAFLILAKVTISQDSKTSCCSDSAIEVKITTTRDDHGNTKCGPVIKFYPGFIESEVKFSGMSRSDIQIAKTFPRLYWNSDYTVV